MSFRFLAIMTVVLQTLCALPLVLLFTLFPEPRVGKAGSHSRNIATAEPCQSLT